MELIKLSLDTIDNIHYGIAFLAPLIGKGAALLGKGLLKGLGKKVLGKVGGKVLGKLGQKFLGNVGGMSAEGQGNILSGLTGGLAGLVGGIAAKKAASKEALAAEQELKKRQQAYESFQFQNPYANMQNVYEDATINQQQAQFQAQQQQQGLANIMGSMQQSAGGSGIAALAQTLAQQQSTNLQQASASIGMQEQQLQSAKLGEAARLQQLEAGGEMQKQQFELGRTETLMDAAAQRQIRAKESLAASKQQLIGGVGSLAGTAITGLAKGGDQGGGFKENFETMGNLSLEQLLKPKN